MRRTAAFLLVATVMGAPGVFSAASDGDWPTVGRDAGAQRFSPLTQITPANVSTLETAWTFDVGASNLQVTPLVVNGMMYVTGGSTIFALEPETARVLWKYEASGQVSRRGVAYWPGDRVTPARLYSGAGDGAMVALDAKTGQPVPGFGDKGYVDLKSSVRGDVDGRFSLVSPPSVYKNIIITGGNNGEQAPSLGLYGDIRGWDARTGRLLWSFHTVPRKGEPGAETWEHDSWKDRSGTNMWAFMTVDEQRGLVFVPTGSPTSDYYGGDRVGKNLYGNSLVALDAATGKLKWYQQLVHHDLWDFDLPAAPTLIDVKQRGRTTPAVAIITKMGTMFIFNRLTGAPMFGMEERPVPKSSVPGESSWPTQPFPLKPEPIARTTFDPAKDFYGLTPDHEAYCKDLWTKSGMYTHGPFTPPSLEGTMLTFPSTLGGGNWNGIAYDPVRGVAYTNVMNLGQVARMVERKDEQSGGITYRRISPWNTPVGRFWNPETKIPCSAPPFGELVAVDVNTASILWKVPLGFIQSLKDKGFANTGALNMGGGIVTGSGLIFIGASTDRRFRAFDARSGAQLWETELEASAHSIPMTFMGKDGRQYVVVAAGGGSFLVSPPGTKIVAFALPTAGGAKPATAAVNRPAGAVASMPSPSVSQPATVAPLPSAPMSAADLPEGSGRDAVITMCSGCHGLAASVAQRRTAAQWRTLVDSMSALGAPGSREEATRAADYLSWRFGRVNVNSATEQDLARVLELSPAQIAAILEYRTHEGAIDSLDELARVPGLARPEIERKADRILFSER